MLLVAVLMIEVALLLTIEPLACGPSSIVVEEAADDGAKVAPRVPDGLEVVAEQPIAKSALGVVQHVGDHEVRPTVMMQVCIADRLLDIEVSLTDRSAFNYLLLLGRSALESFALIDPSETFLSDAECALPGPDAEAAS